MTDDKRKLNSEDDPPAKRIFLQNEGDEDADSQRFALAHAISSNENFQLETSNDTSSVRSRVSAEMRRAYFDILCEDLASSPTPKLQQFISLITTIRDDIIGLLPSAGQTKRRIEETIDLQLIDQQLKNASFDVVSAARFVVATLGQLCAPARDATVAEMNERLKSVEPIEMSSTTPLSATDARFVADTFRLILDALDLVKLDMANFQINMLRPMLRGSDYERQKFAKHLERLNADGVDGLANTKAWLSREAVDDKSNRLRLNSAFARLVFDPPVEYPETCSLDADKFTALASHLARFVCVATALAVRQAKDLLVDEKLCDELLALVPSGESREITSDTLASLALHASIEHSELEPTTPVRQLLGRRLNEYFDQALETTTSVLLPPVPKAFDLLSKSIHNDLKEFIRLTKLNREVFAQWYDQILQSKDN